MHDYRDRGIYMITMVTEGRRPLFGSLCGHPDEKEGEQRPHVVLTAMGEKVEQCWKEIARYHPAVEPMKLCIMPDHIHGLLFVHEQMEEHLGQVIAGFKTGTRKAAHKLGLLAPATLPHAADTAAAIAAAQPPQPSRHTAAGRSHGTLWEPGYHDRLLRHEGQLQCMMDYMSDNPRRLLLKRLHPQYFTRLATITLPGLPPMEAIGNRFLLDRPAKIQVQCSRHLYQEEIERLKESVLERAETEGAVIVSPCISPGESQIATAALAAELPLVVLLLNGFSPTFKPAPRYLEACGAGRLLLLAPYPFQNEKISDMRRRCLSLNDMAAHLCKT